MIASKVYANTAAPWHGRLALIITQVNRDVILLYQQKKI
jgi:hypothetical protein